MQSRQGAAVVGGCGGRLWWAAAAGRLRWAAVVQSPEGAAAVGGCGGRLWWAAAAALLSQAAVMQSRQGAAVVGGCSRSKKRSGCSRTAAAALFLQCSHQWSYINMLIYKLKQCFFCFFIFLNSLKLVEVFSL